MNGRPAADRSGMERTQAMMNRIRQFPAAVLSARASIGPIVASCLLAALTPAALAQEAVPAKPAAPETKPETKPEPKPDAAPATPAPATPAPAGTPSAAPAAPKEKASPMVLSHVVKDIDGKDVNLADYKGKVVLIVNVASNCGFTRQYKGLQALYDEQKDRGLVVLGFPANNFNGQEPGSNSEIKAFCETNYKVTFPMFAKISVKGEDQHPLFKQLQAQPGAIGGEPGWNFTKYLVDRSGNVVARYESRVKPDDATMVAKIRELLDAK